MDLMLKDKVVVITGGAGGVGASLVKAFLKEGAVVVCLDKDKERGEKIKGQFGKGGKEICFIETDVSRPASINRAFDKICKRFSRIDVLVNNAGVFSSTPLLDITPDSWDSVMETNLRSVLLCSQRAVGVMMKRKCGKIINIASMGGQTGGIFAGADYSASKAGIICLTRSLAKSFGKYGIRVNCVNPGPLQTDMTKDWPREVIDRLKKNMLIGENRLGTPDEIANIAVFLASEKASFIQGAQIDANGGIFIR